MTFTHDPIREAGLVAALTLAACSTAGRGVNDAGSLEVDAAETVVDASRKADAEPTLDAAPTDAAQRADGEIDAGADAGSLDGGVSIDAAMPDSGAPTDAGMTIDAGSTIDAGINLEAGHHYQLEIWGYHIPARRRRWNFIPVMNVPPWVWHDQNAIDSAHRAPEPIVNQVAISDFDDDRFDRPVGAAPRWVIDYPNSTALVVLGSGVTLYDVDGDGDTSGETTLVRELVAGCGGWTEAQFRDAAENGHIQTSVCSVGVTGMTIGGGVFPLFGDYTDASMTTVAAADVTVQWRIVLVH